MSRSIALELARPDPLGIRYATAAARGRTYLAWQAEGGRNGVQIVRRHFGVQRYRRITTAPRGLSWTPVQHVWSEMGADTPGDTSAPE